MPASLVDLFLAMAHRGLLAYDAQGRRMGRIVNGSRQQVIHAGCGRVGLGGGGAASRRWP